MSTHQPDTSPASTDAQTPIQRLSAEGTDSSRELMQRVDTLLEAGDATATAHAHRLLEDLLALQVHDESARTHGQFPMRLSQGVGDLNSCVFMLPLLTDLRQRHGAQLPPPLCDRLDAAVNAALLAAQRRWDEEIFDIHRDYKAYTNIFLLYVQALLIGGQHTGDGRLRRMAASQWQRWFNHVSYYGIDEFVSAGNYGDVDYRVLRRLHAQAEDATMARQVELVLDHLTTLQHAITHPRLKLAVCGSSRDYRRFFTAGVGEPVAVRNDDPTLAGAYQPPSAVARGYRERAFPYSVTGRAAIVPFFFQSWQSRHAALGSMTGGNYFPQQIHCMAAVGHSAEQREVLVMPGSYTIISGYVRQHAHRALCLFARQPNTYLRTQVLVPDDQIEDRFGDFGIGITSGWETDEAEGRLVLTAYGHTVTVDPFVIDGGTVRPAPLTSVWREDLGQGRFHDTPRDMREYVFPGDATWLGCVVQLSQTMEPLPTTTVSCEHREGRLYVRESDGLAIELFRRTDGELIELYDQDWRTTPLLRCPEQTLSAGELAAAAVNGR